MLTCATCHQQIPNPVEQINVITDRGDRWCVRCATVSYVDGRPCVLPKSQGLLVEIVDLPRYYSGQLSQWFWLRVAKISNHEDKGVLYFAGILLQEMEERVIHLLEQITAEEEHHGLGTSSGEQEAKGQPKA